MFVLLCILLLVGSASSQWKDDDYSFSLPVGNPHGHTYVIQRPGRITGVRVWALYNSRITGIQLRNGYSWSHIAGYTTGPVQEMLLYENEAIVQLSGKYSYRIDSLIFTTNMGRSLYAGQPRGNSFNMYPHSKKAELRFISGRQSGGIFTIGAHWGVVTDPNANTNNTNTY
ncbi:zymogen granule membrane protein 16-like [Corythoichthys intestinalis]|uniref:zymogen granule membrane protein 16-like n=1 Tax=Corythoichthys intestinalis TaxID=161448 RepID=UPI0025A6112D|nr:zymogen granule membrane protein 16-like [Corythoichthys intestinalis]XP_061808345.1 zymogen granule membrane protein 16-like [Nerophis lumbriciformis]